MAQTGKYFVFSFPLSDQAWHHYAVRSILPENLSEDIPDPSFEIRRLAERITNDGGEVHAETLLALRTINQVLRFVSKQYFIKDNPGSLNRGRQWMGTKLGSESISQLHHAFVELFPPLDVQTARLSPRDFLKSSDDDASGMDNVTLEMILLFLNLGNPATGSASLLFDDQLLRKRASFIPFVTGLENFLDDFEAPGTAGSTIFHLLRAPMLASPDSLAGQIEYIRKFWGHLLPAELIKRLQFALDVLQEIDAVRSGEPGPPPVLEFGPGSSAYGADAPEPEAFSSDADWMSNVVLMAKSIYVWLDQLSKTYGRPIQLLSDIPDEELDRLAGFGVTGLWLIGLWERSEASRRIKQYMGNPEAAASAYALKDYDIAADLGGYDGWRNLHDRALSRGIRLASDMVPNHMGIDSSWVMDHPEYFVQSERPPFPAYDFTGGNLSDRPGIAIRIEDGYWDKRDASVVFQRVNEHTGDIRYIYHGNDGTSMPWNDTAQLDFLLPEVREAVTQVILKVARMFPIIRFDAAMTLAKKHYQRLWFPAPGDAGAIPSRAEHGMSKQEFDRVFPTEFWRDVVDRVASEVPDTLLLAEAFWLMEGYFVRTLGMHRVYNSAFMNMLKMEDNAKYRQTIKNVLEFSPEVLKRFVNFMNNPDEKTAVEQFGRGDKYFGCSMLLVTMPGLPMLGHGQIEGFTEKYGMEYRRAYWDEQVDQDMVQRHERDIFPLMRQRYLFSGVENFALFDFNADGGWVNENVFAYTNGHEHERVLVIYNNAFDSTSGTISLSTAINKGDADHPNLNHSTLAQALGLEKGQNTWYTMYDPVEKLSFLRHSQELFDVGFHTDLNGYQYRIFQNFRQVIDRDGRWEKLATSLAGGGSVDLERALRRLNIEPALIEIRSWFDVTTLALLESTGSGEPCPDEEDEKKKEQPENLVDRAKRLCSIPDKLDAMNLQADLKEYVMQALEELPGSRIPQAVYMAEVLGTVPGPWSRSKDLEISGTTISALDIALVLEDLDDVLREWTGHVFAADSAALLARLLASASGVIDEMAKGKTEWAADWIANEEVRLYLGINEYEGSTWLNREALESLFKGLMVLVLTEPDPLEVESFVLFIKASVTILQAAQQAGYEVQGILDLI